MNSPKTLLRFESVKSFSLWLSLHLLFFITTGCLPENNPLTQNSADGASTSYGGFAGIKSAQTINGTRVQIRWEQSKDPNVVAYNIYDATFRFNPKLIRTVTAPAESVTLSGLANQSLYAFRVRAADKNNKEDNNTTDLKAIPYTGLTNAQVTSSTTARLTFADGSNSDQINILCKTTTDPQYQQMGTVRNTALTSIDLSDLQAGVEYTCRAALEIDGFVDNNENTLTFTPMGQASKIVFETQPGNGNAGQALTQQPVVKIYDANNNLVAGGPDSTAIITLTLASNSPTSGTVRGTISVPAVGGVATFSGINLQESGQKILMASKEDTSSQVFGTPSMTASSSTILISPGPAAPDQSSIAIDSVPAPLIANGNESYTVTITLKDQYGNPISGTRPNFGSSVQGDTLSQPTQNTNAQGVATGSISTTIASTSRKIFVSIPSGFSSVEVVAPFVHGPATKLGFVVQPVNSPAGNAGMSTLKVAVQDAQGNQVTSGTAAISPVTLSIASNTAGAILSGTNAKDTANGEVTFEGLGIDKTGTGYRLVASSGSLTPAYSNTFNITAGVPRKISVTGPPSVLSGACSGAIIVQLQDLGNNPANAIQSTPLTITGLGNGSLYTSNVCGGSPISNTLTFTAGTNTRTLYFKNNSAQSSTISISDSSGVLTTGTYTINASPNKVSLLALAASPPAAANTPLSVVAGQCSTAIIITPQGENGTAGPTFAPTVFSVTGVVGSDAKLYSNSSCTTEVDPLNVTLPINTGPDYSTRLYLKDSRAESLTLSIADPLGVITTTSTLQPVTVLPSKIYWTGPTSAVSGQCSTVFSVQLRDELNNSNTASADLTLNINGIPEASAGRFYTSAACSGSGSRTTLTFPQASATLQIYFKSFAAESFNLTLSDPTARMSATAAINFKVSPSALRIVSPAGTSSKTNICAGPFYVDTLDSLGSQTNAIDAITARLEGAGVSGYFFSDANCSQEVTTVTFAPGENRKTFYYKGYFPENSLNFIAADNASILTSGSASWGVTPSKGWLGTASTMFDENGNLIWFRQNPKVVAAMYDGLYNVRALSFSPDKRYLYVADDSYHRVLKYDYQNQSYIGWIGGFLNNGGINIGGSNLTVPSDAQCVATLNTMGTPGWCFGGQPWADANYGPSRNSITSPQALYDDGNYLYVLSYNNHVLRFNSQTGAYQGFLGWVSNNAGMTEAPGGPSTCSTTPNNSHTPGWCMTAQWQNVNAGDSNPQYGDGRFRWPQAMTADENYLYVASRNMLGRYSKDTGIFAGWIGMVQVTPTGGATGCTTRVDNQITPGWCFGGRAREANPLNHAGQAGGMSYPREVWIQDGMIYILHGSGQIVRYDQTTGAVIGPATGIANNWRGAYQSATDGTNWYFADSVRLIKTDKTGLLEGWVGKVANNASLSGPGCSTLAVSANTPGWCIGGTARPGTDDQSFRDLVAVAYDGNGKLIVGQTGQSGVLKRFDAATGAYEGTLSLESISPKKWEDNATLPMERHGFDSDSMWGPRGLFISGDYLFSAEETAARVKMFNRRTGALIGSIGAITSSPTGGGANCLGANPFAASPGWCLGANFLPNWYFNTPEMINSQANGIMNTPWSITGDGTFIYVTDRALHRISRYRISTGAPEGWIGRIGTSPTGGDPGCSGATGVTPGWCAGGMSASGTGNGHLNNPNGIVHVSGKLYVYDTGNARISAYNAATGAFLGWIGRIGTNPTSGCTYATNGQYNVSTSGWCMGGTAAGANAWNDRGGGLTTWSGTNGGGITSDGNYLYVTNFYNIRVDKYSLDGVYLGSARTRDDVYTSTWSTDPAVISAMGGGGSCSYPTDIWTDGTHLYGVNAYPCNRNGDTMNVWKMNLTTGTIVGWQGGIDPAQPPAGGDPGCAGATSSTPGWCQGGRTWLGLRMGQFSSIHGNITGDDRFIYVSDTIGNRVLRIPK